MNWRHEAVEMGVPPGNPAEARETRTRGVPKGNGSRRKAQGTRQKHQKKTYPLLNPQSEI
jgi:hypothetical protein